VILLKATATAWVAGEPQPGLVSVEFVDALGVTHVVTDKCSVISETLGPRAAYPMEVELRCRVRRNDLDRQSRRRHWIDLGPWGLAAPEQRFLVTHEQLSWSPPAERADLSIAARQALGLIAFRRWRTVIGLVSPILDQVEAHLWDFATVGEHTFDAWYDAYPLPGRGDGEALDADLETDAARRGVPSSRLRTAVDALLEITHDGLFTGVESAWSLAALDRLESALRPDGVPLPEPGLVADSLWINDAWGRPHASVVEGWRNI
jgi:hypothetical protein